MTFLLQSGTNVNSRDISGRTAIHFLTGRYASKLSFRLAHILITEFDAEVDAVDRLGYSPLYSVVTEYMTLQGQFSLSS
jgi:hypothetical protein